MKRIASVILLLLIAGLLFALFDNDPLYVKRRVLSSLYSPPTLPSLYYEPMELVEGSAEGARIPRVTPEQEKLDPTALQDAAAYASEQDSKALVVGRHGHIVFEQYWGGTDFDTLIDAGAFNATITALMVGMAIDDRKIALVTEPVSNYIESFADGDRANITLEHLLHMSSGLGSRRGGVDAWSMPTRDQLVHDIRSHCLEENAGELILGMWAPRACDPQLLAHIIERATGQAYSAYLSSRLWKPIGAGDAYLMLDHEGGTAHASCCMRARLGDWMRVAEVLVTDGKFGGDQILPVGYVRSMLTPAKSNKRFGYQVWLGTPFQQGEGALSPYATDDLFLLKGNGKTRLWIVPSMGLTILRVGTNKEIDPGWDDSVIPNLVIRGATDFVPKAAQDADISNLVPNH